MIDRAAQPRLRVIGVDNAQPIESNVSLDVAECLGQAVVHAQVVARGEGMRRVEAQPQPRIAVQAIEQRADLAEAGAERVAGAVRVLEENLADAATVEHFTQRVEDVLLGLIHGLAASGSNMHDDSNQVTALGPGGACGEGIDRTPADARVWGGEVDQVSGVCKVRTNTNRAHLERKVRYL